MSDIENINTTANDGLVENTAVADTTPSPVGATEKLDNSLDAVISRSFDKLTEKAEPVAPKAAPAAAQDTKVLKVDVPVEADDKFVDPVSGRTLEPIKAPVLSPKLREQWKDVPREFQQYWVDREKDMSVRLQETSDARKIATDFKDVASPYEAMLRQNNVSAVDHARELFKLSHALTTSSPQGKAQIFVQLLNQFQPDPATMQALLAGQPAPQEVQHQRPVDVAAEVDRTLKQRDEQTQVTAGKAALETFQSNPANEFVDDVRDLMGKAIDAGFVQGNTWPELFKNAYDFACQQHPEVRTVMQGRSAARAPATEPAARAQPVPSVKPSLGPGTRTAPPKRKMSLAEATEFAWKAAGGE